MFHRFRNEPWYGSHSQKQLSTICPDRFDRTERLKDLRITTVIAIFEGIEYLSNLYDVVMFGFFPESLLEYSQYLQKLLNPEENRDSALYQAYKGAGIVQSGRLKSKYFELIN
mmetsp:Transcript_3599/g.8668  ORF Transcript_3599/g.8668 Transcript_3599/m.8668 type:complete len:113 (-) Transcript_3599:273-611(-)